MNLSPEQALQRAAACCASTECCREEIRSKLLRWGVAKENVDSILDKLQEDGYIDNDRFCRAYINDKLRFSKWGKAKIRQGLYIKRIPPQTIAGHLAEIDEELYLDILRGLITAKDHTITASTPYVRATKLTRFALGRGFEMDDIARCLDLTVLEDLEP